MTLPHSPKEGNTGRQNANEGEKKKKTEHKYKKKLINFSN